MQEMIEWFRANPDVFGFIVATLIFAITLLLVTFRRIKFWTTLILLVFSLLVGLCISNQNRFFNWLEKPVKDESVAS